MNISLKNLIMFIAGVVFLGLCLYVFEQQKRSSSTNSGLFPIIYTQIQKKQGEIEDLEKNKSIIVDYQGQLQQAYEQANKVNLPQIDSKSLTTIKLDSLIALQRMLRDQISPIFQSTVFSPPYDVDFRANHIVSDLSKISQALNSNFYWIYPGLWGDSSYTYNGETGIVQLKSFLDTANLRKKNNEMIAIIKAQVLQVGKMKEHLEEGRESINKSIEDLQGAIKDVEKSGTDRMLIYVVIPLFSVVVLMLLAIPALYKNDTSIVKSFFEQDILIQVFSVFILVITILLLGIGDKLSGETIGTLLGGISVYVLQRALGDGSRKPGGQGNS